MSTAIAEIEAVPEIDAMLFDMLADSEHLHVRYAAWRIKRLERELSILQMISDSQNGRLDFLLGLIEEIRNADPGMEDMIQWQAAKAAGYLSPTPPPN